MLKLKSYLLILIIVCCIQSLATADDRKPNIVFILADDLGWSDTGVYGNTKLYQTPNIDRLAQRGMRFTRAYSASPLCSPTRAAILTGLSPARTGITVPGCHLPQVVLEASVGKNAAPNLHAVQPTAVTRLKTDYVTLPKVLKNAGYKTAHFGKWHLGHEPYSAIEHGFDVDLPHHPGPGPAGSYVAPWKFKDFDHDPVEPDQHIEDRMAKEAVQWLEDNHDQPFFLNYWMFSVHAPFDAKQSLIEKYKKIVNPAERQNCATYAAMIESMDDAVGTLLDTLDRLGETDNTIIVFTSDNGGNMYSEVDGTVPTNNWPLRGGKASMFEGGTRVPCIVVWPKVIETETVSDAIIQSEDFFPTLLDVVGIDSAKDLQLDGTSFLAALRGESLERAPTFQYFPHSPPVPDWLPASVAVHRDQWKLIRLFYAGESGKHRYLLFDLANDVSESNNLANQYPDLVHELDEEISLFLTRTHAVTPVPNPAFDASTYRIEDEGKARPKKPAATNSAKPNNAQTTQDSHPQLPQWKLRQCTAEVKDGILLVSALGKEPFLGIAPGKLEEAATLRFRIRCNGGWGKVIWLPGGVGSEESYAKEFAVKAGDWADVSVAIPGKAGQTGILRLYLPSQTAPVELEMLEIKGARLAKRWAF